MIEDVDFVKYLSSEKTVDISSRFYRNSEVNASKFQQNLEEGLTNNK